MNKKIIIITIVICLVIFFTIAIENRYPLFSLIMHSVTIKEKSELCKTINGEWDKDHNVEFCCYQFKGKTCII